MKKISFHKGYSVIEILVVVGVFAILSMVAAQSIILTLQSERKNDSMINVKEQIDYAANVIEKNLQTARYVFMYPSTICDGVTATPSVGFVSKYGGHGYFACIDVMSVGTNPFYDLTATTNDTRIASASGDALIFDQRLTGSNLNISDCSFICTHSGEKSYIKFEVTASQKGLPALDNVEVSITRRVFVRTSERE